MKVTTIMIQALYSASKKVYDEKINKQQVKQQAITDLETKFGWTGGSPSTCIDSFQKMMDGERYTFTNNIEHTNYILTHILNDYGADKLGNAIKAANEHVKYQESLGKPFKGISDIISQHEEILNKILLSQTVTVYPDELDNPDETLFEGIKKTVLVNSYERNPIARKKCIEHYGVQCVVCNCDFEKMYGDIGKGFIHVHHLTQLSDIGQGYEVDPVKDLRPVCPNCHAMLHKKNPPYTIDEIKLNINKQSSAS
jgi:5-methylcytosine-specific restriction protein A